MVHADYPIEPIPFTDIHIADSFWTPRLETNRTITLPYTLRKCEETGRIDNFTKAAGWMAGPHEGIFFNDSDLFKVMEGAAYVLAEHPDPKLDAYLDDLIAKVAGAQEADGYLYTARTIDPTAVNPEREGLERWSNLRVNHELYNVGHLYEAAVAHYQATGKRTLLDVALKNADLIDQVFGPTGRRDVPGHQEIELGLVKLYRATGEERYLALAKFFLDERGHAHGRKLYANFENPGYMQDHLPVTQQKEAVGHAVRALYMYSGMADVAALTGDKTYSVALDRIWQDVVAGKLYLTGGVGARHKGEAFGETYELPNQHAYAESCAAIANVLWNQRMFLLHGHARYADLMELTLYNGFLAGVDLNGERFFYPNPLAADGEWAFNKGSRERQPWFDCSCCPTNDVRFLASLPGYIYGVREGNLFVNLYVAGRSQISLAGQSVSVVQKTDYPWNGQIQLTLEPGRPTSFGLRLRIPGWTRQGPVAGDLYTYLDRGDQPVGLTVNGEVMQPIMEDGYALLQRTWRSGDVVKLDLPMPVRRVTCHPGVKENRGRVALMRGPLVYCVEGIDHESGVQDLVLPGDVNLTVSHRPDILGGVSILNALLPHHHRLTAVPYFAWGHRGPGSMAVWLAQER